MSLDRFKRFLRAACLGIAVIAAPGPASAVALAPGDLLVTDVASGGGLIGDGFLVHVDPDTGDSTIVVDFNGTNPHGQPQGIAIDASGDALLGMNEDAQILRVDPVTGAQTLVSSGGFLSFPIGIAVGSAGDLVVAEATNDAIVRVDPVTGAQSLIASGVDPMALAIGGSGDILVLTSSSRILRVDPATGGQTLVSELPLLEAPYRIAVVPQSVPEAASALLIASGLVLGAVVRRRHG